MRSRLILSLGAGLAVALSVLAGRAGIAEQRDDARKGAESGISARIVIVSLTHDGEFGATLEQHEVREIGGRSFIVGTQVPSPLPDEWRAGRRVWLPVDQVMQMVEVESMEELERMYQQDGALNDRPRL